MKRSATREGKGMRRTPVLFTRRCSVYELLPEAEPWGEERDARTYRGKRPVVAHPPCAQWSARLRHLATQDTQDCAPIAVAIVRRVGGVLEHPKHSRLWDYAGLPVVDSDERDDWGGFSIEVNQLGWGHPISKPTWLYIVGTTKSVALRRLVPPRPDAKPLARNPSLRQRDGTPAAFARTLLTIARQCGST